MRSRCACLFAVALIGCSHSAKDPIIGTWTAKVMLNGSQLDERETYAADGSYTTDEVGSRPGMMATLHVHDVGTWKNLGGGRYTQHLADTSWVTENAATVAGAAKAASRFKKNKASIIANANKDPNFTVKWLGDDMFSVTKNDLIVTYKRQK